MKRWLIYAFVDSRLFYYCRMGRTARSAKNKLIRDFNKSWVHRNAGRQIRVFRVELVDEQRQAELVREVEQHSHRLREMYAALEREARHLDALKCELGAYEKNK